MKENIIVTDLIKTAAGEQQNKSLIVTERMTKLKINFLVHIKET
jgi:hypothetical protein